METRVLRARFRGRVHTRGAQPVLSLSRARLSRAVRAHAHGRARARPLSALPPLPRAYTPAPGTNIIACRDKFIADVPQPARKRPALTEENGSPRSRETPPRGGWAMGGEGDEGARI